MPAAVGPTAVPGARSPEQVVRAYAQAFNDFDLPAFLALQSPAVMKFTLADLADAAAGTPGAFVMTTSGRAEVERKYRRVFASTPRTVRVEIVSLLAINDMVVSRDRVTGFADGHVSDELTLYRVRDGLIESIWYLGRST